MLLNCKPLKPQTFKELLTGAPLTPIESLTWARSNFIVIGWNPAQFQIISWNPANIHRAICYNPANFHRNVGWSPAYFNRVIDWIPADFQTVIGLSPATYRFLDVITFNLVDRCLILLCYQHRCCGQISAYMNKILSPRSLNLT